VVASQGAMPSIVSPCVNADARANATIVNARPVPPRSSDEYRWGNFKIDKAKIACVTANTTTATMNPGPDNDTPGMTHAAASSPSAHDARNTTVRSRIRFIAISVGRRGLAVRRTTMTAAESAAPTIAIDGTLRQGHRDTISPVRIVALARSVGPRRLAAGR